MIKLEKLEISDELREKIKERTARFLALSAAGKEVPQSLSDAYRAPDVKSLLRKETADKCAYCESKVPHVDFGDVEHIIPKTSRPDLRFDYANLTYSCAICNNKKGQYFDETAPLLNPYVDDPRDHLVALGPMVLRHPGSDKGLVTQKRLDLNRGRLVEARSERLEAIASLMDQISRTENAGIRAVLLEQVDKECSSEREYAFVVRSYVEAVIARM